MKKTSEKIISVMDIYSVVKRIALKHLESKNYISEDATMTDSETRAYEMGVHNTLSLIESVADLDGTGMFLNVTGCPDIREYSLPYPITIDLGEIK